MRVKLFTKWTAGSVVIALGIAMLLAPRRDIRVYSVDKRLTIYNASYFSGTNVDYSYLPFGQQLKFQCQRLLRILGVKYKPWERDPARPLRVGGQGPALVIYGRIEGGDSRQFEVVTDSGAPVNPWVRFPSPSGLVSKTNLFLWQYDLFHPGLDLRLTNGLYRIRHIGETNDLALIRVK